MARRVCSVKNYIRLIIRLLLSVFLLVSCFVSDARGYLVTRPQNVASVVGSSAEFGCTSNHTYPIWYFYNTSSFQWITLMYNCFVYEPMLPMVTGYSYFAYYQTPVAFFCGLIILDVQTTFAGEYLCYDFTDSAEMHFTVIDSAPICSNDATDNTISGGGYVSLDCVVSFYGPQSPLLSWMDSNGNIIYQRNSTYVNSTLIIPTTTPVIQPYVCNLSFSAPTPDTACINNTCAGNAPVYTQSCSTNSITVSWCPAELNIAIGEDTINSLWLECSATSSNSISLYFVWTCCCETSCTATYGTTVVIPINTYDVCFCTANTVINGIPCSTSASTYFNESSYQPQTRPASPTTDTSYVGDSSTNIAAIVLGIFLVLAVATYIITLVLRWRKPALSRTCLTGSGCCPLSNSDDIQDSPVVVDNLQTIYENVNSPMPIQNQEYGSLNLQNKSSDHIYQDLHIASAAIDKKPG